MAVSTTTAPELTAEQVQRILVKPLEETSTFLAAGVRIIDTAGPVRLPKLGAATTPGWFAENAQITPESDPDFDEIELLPSTIKSVKTLTRFSNELARQSVIALDAALRERLVKDVADTIDTQFWSASNGSSSTLPKGILNYAGQTVASVGALTLDHLLDAEALALAANVDPTRLKWAMTTRELTRKPVIVTNRIPDTTGSPNTGNIVLADFSQIVVARDMSPSVKVLDQTFGDYDQQALRVVARYDVAPLNDDAVVKLTGITI